MLVVEDDAPLRRLLADELGERGYTVTDVATAEEARAAIDRRPFDLVLTDLALTNGSGLDVLAHARSEQPGVPVVFLSGRGTIDDAVRAMKLGAFDFLQKPLDSERLVLTVDKATDAGRLQREALLFRRERALQGFTRPMVGESPAMRVLEDQIARLAATDTTVLIVGESGTGKELVARALHEVSTRAARPFVAVDCGALEGNLLASELFGHTRGA
ncbi:MAG: response regulator, partial [Myxococcales bacterium]|nr:response regulator [Myxococcales bacterium]